MEKQYVEKPRKVMADRYDPAADPPQRGVCLCQLNPAMPMMPHAHVYNDRAYPLTADHMIVFDKVFVDRLVAVLTIAEFEAVYGNVAEGG